MGILKACAVVGVGILCVWLRKALRPAPPRLCGSTNGPPVTASRVCLTDGRHLAYREWGVTHEAAKYRAIFVHGFGGCRHQAPRFTYAFLYAHSIYVVSFDRAGYGQSDPNPGRTIKSEACDIEQLADFLELGDTFYLIAESIGGYSAWGCLKYIPHRIAGVAMIAPATNFFWHGISRAEFKQAFSTQLLEDRMFLRAVHYFPWITYFWMSQSWMPAPTCMSKRLDILCALDKQVLQRMAPYFQEHAEEMLEGPQQGIAESLCRDLKVMFGNWEFEPGDLEAPHAGHPCSVHIWQGDADYLVPVTLQRYVHRKVPWVEYHEMPEWGHLMKFYVGFADSLLRTLLFGEEFSL